MSGDAVASTGALASARDLPDGPAKIAELERIAAHADAAGQVRLGVDARFALIETCRYHGEAWRLVEPVRHCLAVVDHSPALLTGDEVELLRRYQRAAVEALPASPRVGLDQARALLDDLARRLDGTEPGLVAELRCRFADQLGDGSAAREWFARWRAAGPERDCPACVAVRQAELLTGWGEWTEAVRVLEPVLADPGDCTEQPEGALAAALLPYLRLGRSAEAGWAHVRAYRRHRRERTGFRYLPAHLVFCALDGHLARGLAILVDQVPRLAGPADERSVMEFAAAGALLCRLAGEAGVTRATALPDPLHRDQADPAGPAGTTDQTGTTGAAGTTAPTGRVTPTGRAAPPGTAGTAGRTGATEPDGPGGTTGRAGSTGSTGTDGRGGPVGRSGRTGRPAGTAERARTVGRGHESWPVDALGLGHATRLAEVFGLIRSPGTGGGRDVAALGAELLATATDLAGRFDARNGTGHQSGRITARLAERPRTGVPAPLPDDPEPDDPAQVGAEPEDVGADPDRPGAGRTVVGAGPTHPEPTGSGPAPTGGTAGGGVPADSRSDSSSSAGNTGSSAGSRGGTAGSRSSGDGTAGSAGEPVPLTVAMIVAAVERRGDRCAVDPTGTVVGRWGEAMIRFERVGTAGEILHARVVATRRLPARRRAEAYEFVNAWNRDRLQPKAYVHEVENGELVLAGDLTTDLAYGVAPTQVEVLVDAAVTTGVGYAEAVAALP
ncbi:YbjN domain-containing protein [Micromonospora cathayae]|uniref:YbjN domain-containing protein n=1 Tax=Micromonospora cathayae TaxID=3028804 RepID=A0ABY7ZXB5_9ACTN|nr:YbjN domain-containing protein [Micromonospora sp. HUAS 3]WDZ87538.1 YbjN domain-containing protein [Micromonospora sp. HUAS 3]